MTLPSVINEHQERAKVTQLNAAYSILSQAVSKMINDEGSTIDAWGDDKQERIDKFNELFPKYVQVIKTCKAASGCIGTTYFFPSLEQSNYGCDALSVCYVLNNGIGIRVRATGTCQQDTTLSKKGYAEFDTDGTTSVYYGTYLHSCGEILVDLNGPSGPNKNNVDAFVFKIVQNGIVPAGGAKENVWTERFDYQCLGTNPHLLSFGRCTSWIIYNKNMDYLHCTGLSWDGAHTCKDVK